MIFSFSLHVRFETRVIRKQGQIRDSVGNAASNEMEDVHFLREDKAPRVPLILFASKRTFEPGDIELL